MLSPAPSCVKASMDKYKRWVFKFTPISFFFFFWVCFCCSHTRTLLEDDLHLQTRGQLVEKTRLARLQLVRDPHLGGPFRGDRSGSYGHLGCGTVCRKGGGREESRHSQLQTTSRPEPFRSFPKL